jgi:hypothetical protein
VLGLLTGRCFRAAQSFITAVVTRADMVLMVAPTVFASFYASYRDIFGISEIV